MIITVMTMGIGGSILMAAALGFLGLGAVPPTPEWGSMIGDGIPFLRQAPWMWMLIAGVGCSLVGFLYLHVAGSRAPGTKLAPPALVDGVVVPSHPVE